MLALHLSHLLVSGLYKNNIYVLMHPLLLLQTLLWL